MTQRYHPDSPEYHVPQRFSLLEFLALTTLFGLLFGSLRWFAAPVTLSLFLGGQGIVVCLVQMRFGREPRIASTIAGALLLPVWECALCPLSRLPCLLEIDGHVGRLVTAVALGGLLGYCTGTVAAGVFMVTDQWDRFRARRLGGRETLAGGAVGEEAEVLA